MSEKQHIPEFIGKNLLEPNTKINEITIFKDEIKNVKIEGNLWVVITLKEDDKEYLNALDTPEDARAYRDKILSDLKENGYHIFLDIVSNIEEPINNEVESE